MRTNDLVIAGVGIGVSLLAIYLIKSNRKQPKKVDSVLEKRQGIVTTRKSQPRPSELDDNRPKQPKKKYWLSKGSKGKEVERLQIWLLRHHGWKGRITEEFDQQTEKLVQKVFKKDGINKATYEKYQMGIPIHELIKA